MQVGKIKIIFIALVLGMMYVVLFCFVFGINIQTKLTGVTISKEKPALQLKKLMDGDFQNSYNDWFSENFPLRSYFIKGYDQIMFSSGAMVNDIQAGEGGDLHGQMWLDGYLSYSIEDQTLKRYKENLAFIRDKLKEKNILFFYVLSPNKSEIYPETMPWNYKYADKFIPKKAIAREQIIDVLDQLGISYFDTSELMKNLRKKGEQEPFSTTGIHWNKYGATEMLKKYIALLNSEGENIPNIFPTYTYSAKPDSLDTDYRELLNVYSAPYDALYPHVAFTLEEKEITTQVFALTTSYHNSLMELFKFVDMPFLSYKRFYYNQHQTILIRGADGVEGELFLPPVDFNEYDYSEIFLYDIFIIEHNGGELPEAHLQFVEKFADYLRNE